MVEETHTTDELDMMLRVSKSLTMREMGYWVPMSTEPDTFTAFWRSLGAESPQPYITQGGYFRETGLCEAIKAFQYSG